MLLSSCFFLILHRQLFYTKSDHWSIYYRQYCQHCLTGVVQSFKHKFFPLDGRALTWDLLAANHVLYHLAMVLPCQ